MGPKSNALSSWAINAKVIQQRSILKVSDNSGAKTVRCIKVLGGFKKQYAKVGDIIVVSVQRLRNKFKRNAKVRRKEIYKALILEQNLNLVKKPALKYISMQAR